MKEKQTKLFQQILKDINLLGKKILFVSEEDFNERKIKIVIITELIELLECYNWKPWSKFTKKDPIREINKKIEIIDTFISSIIFFNYNRKITDNDIDYMLKIFEKNKLNNKKITEKEIIKEIEKTILNVNICNEYELIKNILKIAAYEIISIEELIKLTITKIALVEFRNNNGYKEKKYKKEWKKGMEDNHYIYFYIFPNLLEKNMKISDFKKQLLFELEKNYKKIKF